MQQASGTADCDQGIEKGQMASSGLSELKRTSSQTSVPRDTSSCTVELLVFEHLQ
jgi:hypothetical protein